MSNDRPKGSYTGPLSLQWCNYSMTVRAMPMNYLAADLSRIDAALWGRESEIGAAIAEAPAMLAALAACDEHCQAGLNSASPEHWEAALQDILDLIRPIVARIEGKA